MITFEEAFRIVTESSFRIGKEVVRLDEAAGRALVVAVRDDMDMPPWNGAVTDMHAGMKDLGHELTVLETVAAGYAFGGGGTRYLFPHYDRGGCPRRRRLCLHARRQ
ncbi:MAG: hypothetical protein R2756_08810 [Bacteroidales bacterium]